MLYIGILLFTILIFIQPQDFMPGLKGQPVIALVMGLVGAGWLFKGQNARRPDHRKANQDTLMLAFWFMIVLSTVTVDLSYAWNTLIGWGKTVIIYFLLVAIVDTQDRLKGLLWTVVLSMGVTGAMGVLQFYGIDYTGLGTHLGGRIRGVGIFGTNQLAYALGFCTPLAFALFVTTPSRIGKSLLIATFAVYCYGIYLTQSRGGLLCLVAVLLLLFSFFSKQKAVKVAGAVLCVIVFVLLVKFAPRFSSTFEYESDGSAMGRLEAWGGGLMALKDNPLTGIGKEQFVENFSIAPHNSYIEAVTELGIPGLFIWLGFFYYSLKSLRTIANNGRAVHKESVVYSKALQISLYAYLIGSYFSASAYYIPLYMLIAMTVILQRLSAVPRTATATRFAFRDLANIAAIEAAVLIMIRVML